MNRKSRGSTLIEVVIAVMILAGAIIALSASSALLLLASFGFLRLRLRLALFRRGLPRSESPSGSTEGAVEGVFEAVRSLLRWHRSEQSEQVELCDHARSDPRPARCPQGKQ